MITLLNIHNVEYMKDEPDKSFDIAFGDPVYFKGVSRQGFFGNKSSMLNVKRGDYEIPDNWDNLIPTEEYFKELVRVSKYQIIFGINYFDFIHAPGRIIWDKCNDKAPFSHAEIASTNFHDSVRIFRFLWNGMIQGKSIEEPTTAQGNKKLNEKRICPTHKPVPLYEMMLRKYAKPGMRILDTNVGGGSLEVAAIKVGNLDVVGCEIDKNQFNRTVNRLISL